jgi:hypothetical protein
MLVSSSASAVQLLVLKGVPQGKKKTVAGTERGHQAAGHETDGGERAREEAYSELTGCQQLILNSDGHGKKVC